MIRQGRFLSGFFLFLVWMAHSVPAEAQSSAVQSVGDSKGQFTIDFPADWRVVKPASGLIAVLGVAPATEGSNPASVNVVVEGLPRAMSPQTYAALSERMLRAVFHDYTLVQQGTTMLAGRSAYYRYYTWQANTGQILYQVQVYFTVGQKGFVVTGSTLNDPDHTRMYVPIIAQIIDTFRPTIKGSAVSRGSSKPQWRDQRLVIEWRCAEGGEDEDSRPGPIGTSASRCPCCIPDS